MLGYQIHGNKVENLSAHTLHVRLVSCLTLRFTEHLSSGRSSVSPDERFIVVSNLFDGFDWYSLSDKTLRHTIPIHINPQMNLPVPVTFTKDGHAVVAGGTSKNARVLDSRTSETTQLLPHDGMFKVNLRPTREYLGPGIGDIIQAVVGIFRGFVPALPTTKAF